MTHTRDPNSTDTTRMGIEMAIKGAYDGTWAAYINHQWETIDEKTVLGPATGTDNAVVRFDGTTGKLLQNSSMILADDGTVNIPLTKTYNINGSPHTHAFSALSGVAIDTPLDDQFLRYNGVAWVNESVSGGTGEYLDATGTAVNSDALDGLHAAELAEVDLHNIEITGQAEGDLLYYNGTQWVRLAKGAVGTTLRMKADGSIPEWRV